MSQQMNQAANEPNADLASKAGRQPVLDAVKRQRVFGMVAMGSSRREAAKAVGVHVSTIGRTMARDPQFAEEMTEAELLGRNRPLRAMYDAVQKHWRAAAWMLERRRPEEFARRRPGTYTARDVREMVDRMLEEILPLVAKESDHEKVMLIADRQIEALKDPQPAATANPLLEWAEMDAQAEEFRREQQEKIDAAASEDYQREAERLRHEEEQRIAARRQAKSGRRPR